MNELDLLLAESVEASRRRRQMTRTALKPARRDKINLVRSIPRFGDGKATATAP